MISEGSSDTEAWSNDAENSALHHSTILIYFQTENYIILFVYYYNNIAFF